MKPPYLSKHYVYLSFTPQRYGKNLNYTSASRTCPRDAEQLFPKARAHIWNRLCKQTRFSCATTLANVTIVTIVTNDNNVFRKRKKEEKSYIFILYILYIFIYIIYINFSHTFSLADRKSFSVIVICHNCHTVTKKASFYSKTKLVCEKMEWNTETQRHRALFFERTEFTE